MTRVCCNLREQAERASQTSVFMNGTKEQEGTLRWEVYQPSTQSERQAEVDADSWAYKWVIVIFILQ